MNKIILSLMVVISSGCTSAPPKNITQTHFELKLSVVDSLPAIAGKPQLARTTVGGGFCTIELTQYPKCLLHEIRHCFEGNWHKGRETTQNC